MGRMEITPRELRDIEIRESLRGYNRDEVNDLLERAAATIEAANERLQQVTDRLQSAQSEAGRTRETEDVLHRTLLLAQRAADEAVAEATAKSRQMLDDAEMQARRLVADSEAEARRKGESERRKHEEEVMELAGRRDALLADVEALTRFEAEYRERMVRALEADLFALRSRPSTAPGTRPETSDVEVPAETQTGAQTASDNDHGLSFGGATAAAPATTGEQPVVESAAPANSASAASTTASPGTPIAPSEPDPRMTASATHEVDVRTLFEQSPTPAIIVDDEEAAASAPSAARSTASANAAAPGPIDLLGNDGADADVLDDDAFFATLRDAVHDESPLGPRDDNEVTGDHRFFDQDDERGSFRDVFRRRR